MKGGVKSMKGILIVLTIYASSGSGGFFLAVDQVVQVRGFHQVVAALVVEEQVEAGSYD